MVLSLLKMSISAAVLILVIVAGRAVAIHRLPKKTFLVLWRVALGRLLIPFSLPLPLHIYTNVGWLDDTLLTTPATTTPSAFTSGEPTYCITNLPNMVNLVPAKTTAFSVSPLVVIWLMGLLACALYFLVMHLRCSKVYRTSLPLENDFVRQWLREHRTWRTVQIRQSDLTTAPLTYGIWRPVVLLPKITDWEDIDCLRYILAHEFVHIKRLDILFKWLLAAALCVHWFNPLVWIMYILANRDLELSCDEIVVRTYGEQTKSAYALTLIALEERRSGLIPLCASFSKNPMEERIVAIMKLKKPSIFAILTAVILVVGAASVFVRPTISDQELTGQGTNSMLDLITVAGKQELTSEILEQFNDLGVQHTLRFAPEYTQDGKFVSSWDEVLLYLYKSGYSRGGAMRVDDIEKIIYNLFGTKATFSHQSTDHFVLDGERYIPKGIAYTGESAYQVVLLNANPDAVFYEAKLLQFDYDTTVANTNNPNSTANAHRLGDKGTGNIERIAQLIRSQQTDDLIPCRAIDISFFIDRDTGQVTFDSISFTA